jgi:hypothetical protein
MQLTFKTVIRINGDIEVDQTPFIETLHNVGIEQNK